MSRWIPSPSHNEGCNGLGNSNGFTDHADQRRVARSAGMSIHDDVMQALVHLTLTYAEQLARDVQLFARHAKRKRVEPDDIILSAHRNQDLTKKLRELAAVVGQEGRAIKSKANTFVPGYLSVRQINSDMATAPWLRVILTRDKSVGKAFSSSAVVSAVPCGLRLSPPLEASPPSGKDVIVRARSFGNEKEEDDQWRMMLASGRD
ncbi:unnamed protein product [Closterium sp. NIES-54]